jgi:hypothetical protein
MHLGATSPTVAGRMIPRPVPTVLLCWLAMVGADFFLHAGLLAPLYDWGSAFLLEPSEAFVRIPIAYLGFLVVAIALLWLLPQLDVDGGRDGALIAGALGAVAWGVLLLGLWSISTARPALLAGWWIGQTVELGLGGLVIGSILGGASLRSMAWRVGALVILGTLSAVVLQTVGYATAPVLTR